jgi:hypothetical protein
LCVDEPEPDTRREADQGEGGKGPRSYGNQGSGGVVPAAVQGRSELLLGEIWSDARMGNAEKAEQAVSRGHSSWAEADTDASGMLEGSAGRRAELKGEHTSRESRNGQAPDVQAKGEGGVSVAVKLVIFHSSFWRMEIKMTRDPSRTDVLVDDLLKACHTPQDILGGNRVW